MRDCRFSSIPNLTDSGGGRRRHQTAWLIIAFLSSSSSSARLPSRRTSVLVVIAILEPVGVRRRDERVDDTAAVGRAAVVDLNGDRKPADCSTALP